MRAGWFFAIKPALYGLVFYGVDRFLVMGWEGLVPPFSLVLRALPALVLFWRWPREALAEDGVFLFYGAYSGAVLDPSGWLGALWGLLLAALVRVLAKTIKPRLKSDLARLVLTVAYVAASVAVATVAILWLGWPSGWLLPLVLLLSEDLGPVGFRA